MQNCSNFPKIFFDSTSLKPHTKLQPVYLLQTIFTNSIDDIIQLKLTDNHLQLYSKYSQHQPFILEGQIPLNVDLSYQVLETKIKNKNVLNNQKQGQFLDQNILRQKEMNKQFKQQLKQNPNQDQNLYKKENITYLIKFRRKNKLFELYHPNKQQVAKWKKILINKIIQYNFNAEYKLTSRIGKGTFSEVYHAINLLTKQKTAVKLFKKSVINQNPNKKILFQNEIKMLRKINNHPNIIQLLGVFQSAEYYYLQMKLVRGGQLAYKIQSKQRFQPTQIKQFIKKLLEGLEYIHSKGIIHRDIKPQNIMFNEKNEPVIVDFGFATDIKNIKSHLYKCGTIGFMPPQILKLKSPPKLFNPVWDVFSAGVIFYMMLFNQSPFQGKSSISLIKQGVSWTPYSIQLYQNEYTKGTMDLLTKMLDENPSSRISSQQSLSHPYFEQQDFIPKQNQKLYMSYYQEQNTQKIQSLNYSVIGKQNKFNSETKSRFLSRRLKTQTKEQKKIDKENEIKEKI